MAIPTSAQEYYFSEIGSYENLVLGSKTVEQPKANDVLVKVHAVSLQYRDLQIAIGAYAVSPPNNLVPCSDMAGEIVAVGQDVKRWKAGDRVCANFATDHLSGDVTPDIQNSSLGGKSQGVLTEYRSFPAHSLVRIPEHLSYEEASTLPCAALTAYNALMGPKPVKAGDYVLVLGTGGVSIFGLQLAVASGAIVIATSSSDEKLKLATKLGAKHVINYKTTPAWDDEVLRITGGVGVDHVIEVGGGGTLVRSFNSVRMGGGLHIIGHVTKEGLESSIILPIIMKSITLRGIHVGSVQQFENLNRLLIAHPETTRPVINRVFTFEQAKEAYAYLGAQTHSGKLVIKVAA